MISTRLEISELENGRMDRVEFAGGYFSLINDSTGYADISARSYVLDYPGSVRAVCDGESGKLLESIDYMPSGLVFGRMNHDMPHRRFFCGKEELPLTELKLYDSTARLQDAYIPRFTTMDPLAEKYYHISPYNYGANNPVNMIDPDGRDWIDKVVGVIIGTVTNVIPGTSNLRDTYSPNDAGDYNNTLRTVDGVSIVVGGGMMTGGGAGVGAGTSIVIAGGVTASTVVGAPEGAAIAAGGAVVITGSEVLMAGGAMLTANAVANNSKGYNYGKSNEGISTTNKENPKNSKGTLSGTKKALQEVHEKVGGSLPKGKPGKMGSPQRGDAKKGYRLDPGHPNRPVGDAESGPHINWWDYTKGKRGTGGNSGAVPIK